MKNNKISELEFIALMAFLMSNVALAIDGILPALSDIGTSLNNTDPTDLQLIITLIFLGLGIGQLIFGSISDSFGRKPIVYVGVGIFILGSIICLISTNLTIMIVGRLLQGFGLSAPRSICISIIRDSYRGDYMARIMSFVTVVFILVPMIAPILGQFILNFFNWQAIFIFQVFFILITIFWFAKRQRETLPKEKRIPFTKTFFIDGTKEFFRHKSSVIYTLISGVLVGSFMVYLSSSSQVFQEQYGMKTEFAYIFAALSISLGISAFLNGSLVVKFGMKKLAKLALNLFIFSSLIYSILFYNSINPNLIILLLFLSVQFLSLGFIFGNVRALAMQPLGHIAGVGAALNGFISIIIAVPIAILIGHFIIDSALPLFIGFLCCGVMAFCLLLFLKKNSN